MTSNYEHYVFDLYGTLIDIHTDEHAAKTWKKWCKYLDSKNIKHPAYYRFRSDFFALDKKYRKVKSIELNTLFPEIDIIDVYRELFIEYGNPSYGDDFLNEVAYAFRVASRDYIKLFPNAKQYLEMLTRGGKHTYILSNAQRSYTWPEIEMFELDTITTDQLISSDYGYMKPERAYFDILINRYNMNRASVIMHGDSYESDVRGAHAAQIDSVHLFGDNAPNTYYTKQLSK